MNNFDSIIFDMDGTLWDAVASYCKVWDVTFEQCGIDHAPVSRQQLISYMGMTIDKIIGQIIPEKVGDKDFYDKLDTNEKTMMPQLGGVLYPDVSDVIAQISKTHKLFMVSNCAEGGLPSFLEFTSLKPYFIDTLSYGQTKMSKADNIIALVEKYKLTSPLYVGDTQGDADAAAKAGVPVVWASYGFGHIDKPDYTLSCFKDLKKIL